MQRQTKGGEIGQDVIVSRSIKKSADFIDEALLILVSAHNERYATRFVIPSSDAQLEEYAHPNRDPRSFHLPFLTDILIDSTTGQQDEKWNELNRSTKETPAEVVVQGVTHECIDRECKKDDSIEVPLGFFQNWICDERRSGELVEQSLG